jgi:uroporphyrinogen decarboxylase
MTRKLTSHERFKRMFEHRQADRVPIIDSPWAGTIRRWRREGMPEGVPFWQFFDIDHVGVIGTDTSPRYPIRTVEETDEYRTVTTRWGGTQKEWKQDDSTPEFLEFTITGPEAWAEAKRRMVPAEDRVDWVRLKENHAAWKRDDLWIQANLWFGFDVTHSWMVGTERVLMAMVERPEWLQDMWNHELDVQLALLEIVLDRGYTFDSVFWYDDMGYKQNQFFSLSMYRDLLKPVHRRAIEWAHAHGLRAHLHSCGDIRPFVPELVDIGLDALNPLEVKAGMDPLRLKADFGDRLVLHGGINAVLWNDAEKVTAEMRRLVPTLKADGGYIFSSDHSVPNTVSLETFRAVTDLAKELGSYE